MRNKLRYNGFTLIELLVVLAIIALLLTIAVPRYFQSIDASKEKILIHNLQATRLVIDKYYEDTGKYPDSLLDLVNKKYLRTPPFDPITGSTTTWIIIPPDNPDLGNVYNIKSGANGQTKQGQSFSNL